MSELNPWLEFRREVNDALSLLAARAQPNQTSVDVAMYKSLPSLLQQCQDRVASHTAQTRPVLRSVHHFACSGGTLLSRCLGAMPGSWLLSEVDPLSPLISDGKQRGFSPTDLISLARRSSRPPDEATLIEVFLGGLQSLYQNSVRKGMSLVLRDHAHGQFCSAVDGAARPSLRDILQPDYDLRMLVTVRHPLDSYLSLTLRGWLHFHPQTLEEYAIRYLAFLNHYSDVTIQRYEEFVQSPEDRMKQMCEILELPFNSDFLHTFPVLSLTGDSGRSGADIRLRPRREIDAAISAEIQSSPSYSQLCERLGYDSSERGLFST